MKIPSDGSAYLRIADMLMVEPVFDPVGERVYVPFRVWRIAKFLNIADPVWTVFNSRYLDLVL